MFEDTTTKDGAAKQRLALRHAMLAMKASDLSVHPPYSHLNCRFMIHQSEDISPQADGPFSKNLHLPSPACIRAFNLPLARLQSVNVRFIEGHMLEYARNC